MALVYDLPALPHLVLLTDSRYLSDPKNTLFVSIKGERHDGHDFIPMLYQKGLRYFIVEKEVIQKNTELLSFLEKSDIQAFVVENAIKTLQKIAATYRRLFTYPVIGITGSNGKTIVKEWLSAILSQDINIVKSPRSYNSQIGVALSVWDMNENHELGIFEAGISQVSEMQQLQEIIQPEIGIFTNIGSAHNSGFKSIKQKISEKLRLFRNSKALVYCRDHKEVQEEIQILLKAVNPKIELIGWSKQQNGSLCVDLKTNETNTDVKLYFNGDEHSFTLPFIDDASVENALHCAFTAIYLERNQFKTLDFETLKESFLGLKPIAMRLELKQGINENYIIDDSYNNDLGGLKMALNFMSQNHTKRKKVLIISDIQQTGLSDSELARQFYELVKGQELSLLVAIGPKLMAYQEQLSTIGNQAPYFFNSTDDFIKFFDLDTLKSALILIKGARSFSFEKIVNKFVRRTHGTVFEINLNALTQNLNFYRAKIGKDTKIMVMVKAFAYGSGSTEVASLLQYHRIDYLSVAYPDEGVSLRQNGIKLPIMVLNSSKETFHKLFEFDLEPEIFSPKILEEYIAFKNTVFPKAKSKIHIKIDTGMHRLGFEVADLADLCAKLGPQENIEIASIFSHLVGADEAHHNDFSLHQIDTFKTATTFIESTLNVKPLKHICNSAGIMRFPEAKFDMVRLGIGLYGIEAADIEPDMIEPIGTFKSTISQIKTVNAGETIGYGRNGIAEKDMQLATVAVGYADGYDRRFSKGVGQMLVNDTLCPVIGNVCMDMTMIDVSQATCTEGVQVILFGKNPHIKTLANQIGTIPYELLTGISERVKRVFFYE
jgi:Alr-MurF fusion protein